MDSTSQSADAAPLPAQAKERFTDQLIARLGTGAPDRATIDLLWRMIDSATWQYRQETATGDPIDTAAVTERAARLDEQFRTLGLDEQHRNLVTDAVIDMGICLGFFGIARDLKQSSHSAA